MAVTRSEALALDEADPLAERRGAFAPTTNKAIYADGNSLGPPLRAIGPRLARTLAEWSNDLVSGWDRWLDVPFEVGDRLGAACLGASAGQTVVCDSTSVNLLKAIGAAIEATPGRSELVVAAEEFPTDRYLLQSIAAQRGLELIVLDEATQLAAACTERTAVVVASAVNYRSGELLDIRSITESVHAAGAEIVWDLCHAAGAVPLQLDAWGVRLAVGCTYKYLNSGPGAPAFVYVARAHQGRFRQPLWGWFGQRDQFAMGPHYNPADGMRSWLVGTPNIIGIEIVDENVRFIADVGIEAIRAKSEALVAFAQSASEEMLTSLGWTIVTPPTPYRRGGHLAIARHDAEAVCAELIARELVLPDFRAPDVLRLGFSPLPTQFVDVYDAVVAISSLG